MQIKFDSFKLFESRAGKFGSARIRVVIVTPPVATHSVDLE